MKKPFKFRYVNEIVGIFVLIVVALLLAAIVVTGRVQGWFEPTYEVRTLFPPEGSLGLQRGSEVRVLDTPAGIVVDITPREDGVLEGVFRIRGRFFDLMREDSTGIVKRVFGVAGDAFLEIGSGQGARLDPENAFIPVIKDTELLDLAESLIEEVRATTVPAIEQLQKLLEEHTGLAQDVRNPEGDIQQLIGALNRVAHGLEAGEGPAGRLLSDPELAAELDALVAGVQTALEQVNAILADVAETTAQLPDIAELLKGELDDVPGLVYQTQATLQEAEVLIEGIQRHWLIRRHIEKGPRPESERLAPAMAIGAERGQP